MYKISTVNQNIEYIINYVTIVSKIDKSNEKTRYSAQYIIRL